ncbi:AAA family ATPase [Palaeococcus ferrophilus]|uniref:AAA family ATPase n=1 Tax=Palaeococcus ferrophilus TaxID=83868 RepID=UPI00064F3CEC|nr:AAA family ATPase [Palaeococcus ferrophilus]
MQLKKLIVKNFKSIRDCEIELGKLNVLIGANASGKTNLIEVFKLLRKIYVEKDTNPFLEWWGYNNVVWGGKEELPITIGMLFDVNGYEVYFETTFTGTGGSFRILKEQLEIKDYVKIEKEGTRLRIFHDPGFVSLALSKLNGTPEKEFFVYKQFVNMLPQRLYSIMKDLPIPFQEKSLLSWPWRASAIYDSNFEIAYTVIELAEKHQDTENSIPVLSPIIRKNEYRNPLVWEIGYILHRVLLNTLILSPPCVRSVKKELKFPRKESALAEDASNLVPVLYNIWLREGKLPAEISEPLSIAFPNTRIFFQLTEDGRVMMKVFEGELELAPPGISDGFYKTLAILTAAYLKPSLLVIDEVENSLHPETLELLFDTLRESESQVIITTHSPVVVDMTDPADVIFVEKVGGETRFKRIPDPEEIKRLLREKGLAFSEGWLYGEIFNENNR